MEPEKRSELIEEYGRGFDLLTDALAEVSRETWKFKPAPGEWSVHEVLVHMTESESMAVIRLHKLIAEPGSTLMPYDEEKWAETLDYQNQSVDDALQIFRLMRQTTYRLLKTLPDRVFTYSVMHPGAGYPEYGELYTLEKWLNIYTSHVRNHIGQLKKTYQAWKEQNK
jgi:predicted HTH transcriptional regulator